MNNALTLRISLVTNAVFSLVSAGLMVFSSSLVGEMLGIQAPLILQLIGVGLFVFAADLLHQATRSRIASWRALYASIGDLLWVLATLVLLGFFPDILSRFGTFLVAAVAVIVFALSMWQLWAIGNTYKVSGKDEYRYCIPVYVNAPADKMWSVISRLGDIRNYAPSVKNSFVVNGETPGVGAVRVCEDFAGKRWSEECVVFEAGRGFVVRFVSEAPDFPFPVQSMRGGWEIIPRGHGSQVTVWWELVPKPKRLAPIILPLLTLQADRVFPKTIQRMAMDALGLNSEVASQDIMSATVRVLPNLC